MPISFLQVSDYKQLGHSRQVSNRTIPFFYDDLNLDVAMHRLFIVRLNADD